jgi:hypothetical protein
MRQFELSGGLASAHQTERRETRAEQQQMLRFMKASSSMYS